MFNNSINVKYIEITITGSFFAFYSIFEYHPSSPFVRIFRVYSHFHMHSENHTSRACDTIARNGVASCPRTFRHIRDDVDRPTDRPSDRPAECNWGNALAIICTHAQRPTFSVCMRIGCVSFTDGIQTTSQQSTLTELDGHQSICTQKGPNKTHPPFVQIQLQSGIFLSDLDPFVLCRLGYIN